MPTKRSSHRKDAWRPSSAGVHEGDQGRAIWDISWPLSITFGISLFDPASHQSCSASLGLLWVTDGAVVVIDYVTGFSTGRFARISA